MTTQLTVSINSTSTNRSDRKVWPLKGVHVDKGYMFPLIPLLRIEATIRASCPSRSTVWIWFPLIPLLRIEATGHKKDLSQHLC